MRIRWAMLAVLVVGLAACGGKADQSGASTSSPPGSTRTNPPGSTSPGSGAPGTTSPDANPPGTTDGGQTGPGTTGTAAALGANPWALQSYGPTPTPAAAPATLAFQPLGALEGTTGCNTFSGSYTVDGSRLSLTLGPMTLIGCTDPAVGAQEQAITLGLPGVTGFRIEGDQLVLTDDQGGTRFTYVVASSALGGTAWTITGLNNGRDAVEGTPPSAGPTLSFVADGQASAFGGCNQLTGTYVQGPANALTLSLSPTTANPCPPENAQIEQQLLAALAKVTTADQRDGTITMRSADGAIQIVARRTR